MDLSGIPVIRYVWALWRVGEARLQARHQRIPPAVAQFQLGEIIPLKGFEWRVAHIGPHGFVLAPTAFTRKRFKRLVRQERRRRLYVAQSKAGQ